MDVDTYCITLPEYPTRMEAVRSYFLSNGLQVKFFYGIHAERFGLYTGWRYDVDHPGTGYHIGGKNVGCWLSHYMLWSALTLAEGDHFMVLEDDAEFCPNWRTRMDQALADVPPDFDMLYVGSCNCGDKPKTQVKGEVWDVRYPFCTHAYIVARKALPVLIATQRKVYAPIDCSMTFHSHPLLKVYTVLPRIFNQKNTFIQD